MWPNWGAITFCMSFKGRFYQPWWGVKKFCNELEEVDEYLLRQILNAHSKTPKEMLHLETGTIPVEYIIKSRRLSYLHHILTREKYELISKVFYAQKRKPVKDDWAETVKKDMDEIQLNLSEENIKTMKKNKFKEHLKKKINQAAFNDLLKRKDSHSKVDHINFKNFEAQAYIKSYKFKTVDKQLLFKLRTRMTNVKANFKTMHENIHCDLCDEEVLQNDALLLDNYKLSYFIE